MNKLIKSSLKVDNVSGFSFNKFKQPQSLKKAQSVVIGFDIKSKAIKFLTVNGLNFSTLSITEYRYESPFMSQSFMAEFNAALQKFLATLPANSVKLSRLVLPNCLIVNDAVNLPSMPKNKLIKSINSQLQLDYKNYDELKFKSAELFKSRQTATYLITAVKKQYLSALYSALSAVKLTPKYTGYSASCAVNTLINFNPAYRKKSFIYLTVQSNYTSVVAYLKGNTVGFSSFDIGFNPQNSSLINDGESAQSVGALIAERALLYAENLRLTFGFFYPEFITVNATDSLTEAITQIQSKIPFVSARLPQEVKSDCNIIGALYSGVFGKCQSL